MKHGKGQWEEKRAAMVYLEVRTMGEQIRRLWYDAI